MNDEHQPRILSALVIGFLMILTAFATFNASGSYTSPGTGQTCTLNWLAGQTSAVQRGAGSNYTLTDDVTISGTDTFQMNNGEHLWINNARKLTINGNLDINGQQNSKVYIAMTNGQRSDSINVDWNYNSNNPNTIDIDYLDITNIKLEFTDQDSMTKQYYAWYPTEDTNPIIITPMVGAFVPGDSHGYAIYSNTAFKDITTIILRFNIDSDSDGVPNWWEEQNGFDPNTANNWNTDTDGDGLSDGNEYQFHTNPRVQDTDGDTLNDGPEVGTYYSNPLKQYSDSDGYRDDEEVTAGVDGYITDPSLSDTDGDGIDDDDEHTSSPITNPTKYDTDDDDFGDYQDNQPTLINRKFAFLFEITNFNGVVYGDKTADIDTVANELDSLGFHVYLYDDHDYSTLNAGVTETIYAWGTWANFKSAWSDFKSQPNAQHPIGSPPSGYGQDTVLIYIDSHGLTVVNTYSMVFPNSNGLTNTLIPEYDNGGSDGLENQLDDLGSCLDYIWIQTENSQGWHSDIANYDDLNAGHRVVVTTTGAIGDNQDVFADFMTAYYLDLNAGFDSIFDNLNDKDNHICDELSQGANKIIYLC